MWMIGAGIAVAGLLSMVFAGIGLGLLVIAAGALIMAACCWGELRAESRANEWRRAYPSYKY